MHFARSRDAFCRATSLLDLTQGRFGGPYERSIDVLISRIRQKIERDPKAPEIIKTVRSEGYLFTPRVDRG